MMKNKALPGKGALEKLSKILEFEEKAQLKQLAEKKKHKPSFKTKGK